MSLNEENGLEDRKARLKEKRKRYLAAVMEKTGWDRAYARQQIREARKRLGCSWFVYAYFGYYNMTEAEQEEAFRKWQARRERKKMIRVRKLENSITEIVDETGWSREKAMRMYEEARDRTHCRPEEYCQYRFWELDEESQASIVLSHDIDQIVFRFNTDLNMKRLISVRRESNKFFAPYIGRKWCSNKGISLNKFMKTFAGCTRLFYNPATAFSGYDAKPYDLREQSIEEVYELVRQLPRGVVEEYVTQHPKLEKLRPGTLNTIRIATISSPDPIDKDGNHFAIPYAVIKMGGVSGYVDKLSEGGLCAGIDLDSGRICTDGMDIHLNTYKHHPYSNARIRGMVIPYFEETKALVRRITEEKQMKGFFTWGIAITRHGPVMIEVKGHPGHLLVELPYYNTPLRGRKEILKPYMLE